MIEDRGETKSLEITGEKAGKERITHRSRDVECLSIEG